MARRSVILVAAVLASDCRFASATVTEPPKASEPAITCASDQMQFHGKCVERDQCCDDTLCPAGTVFEFVREPRCVPCPDAETQSGAAYCAGAKVDEVDKQLNALYRDLLNNFPAEQQRLKTAERMWVVFRDRFCEAYAGICKAAVLKRKVFSANASLPRRVDSSTDYRTYVKNGRSQKGTT
jgi:uncharacterized protein YecT (DUF1311 family)